MNNLPAVIDYDAELKGATMLVKSGLTPKDINRPEAALFVILAGRDMGLSPVQSLRSIRIIQGKLELSADIQLGKFHERGGKSQWLELTDTKARLKLVAPWSIEAHVSTFDIDAAKRAGLLSNQTWTKYPKAMLRSRAITQGLKDIGFILGSGVYAPGEVSGSQVIIDEATGEVLPGETTFEQKVQDVNIAQDLSDVAMSELSEDDKEHVTLAAQLIATALDLKPQANVVGAYNVYMELSAEKKAAVKNLLSKAHKKTIRDHRQTVLDAVKARNIDLIRNMPSGTSAAYVEGEVINVPDVSVLRSIDLHVEMKEFDLARDLARSIDDGPTYASVVTRIKAAEERA